MNPLTRPLRRALATRRSKVATVVAAGAAVFLVASGVLFVWPRSDQPEPAGAILSLNGPMESARAAVAISLAERGLAPVLLFSEGHPNGPCPEVAGVDVVCFAPQPARTVGEISFAAAYARKHGIDSMIVVAGHTQTTRARLLSARCFAGRTMVVASPESWWRLPYDVLYEWGAMFKALVVDRGCD